jgi:amino acid adenylation domain-containing protein
MRLLQDWVTEHAQRRPESTAVVSGGRRLTYGELDARSTQLARLLREAGCRDGDRVALLTPKSATAIVALLGIYKADAIYVPLDPSSPSARLTKILSSCGCRWMLAGGSPLPVLNDIMQQPHWHEQLSIGWLEGPPPDHARVDFTLGDLPVYSTEPRAYRNRPGEPAHILFTSGSTGVPKGVVVTHANVVHCVDWAVRHFGITAADRLSGHPPLHFDMSFMDIFGAAAAGAEVHLVPSSGRVLPGQLADFIRTSAVTQWFSVPSALNYMAQFDLVRHGDFPSLRRVLWAGDVLPTPALIYWMTRLPHATFTNLYGPTETTIVSSHYTVPACPGHARVAIPIGSACDGEELLVLDRDMRSTAPGAVGEIYIGGRGVAAGYWRDAAQTSAAFVADPRNLSQRLYRTGDLGKVDRQGLTYVLGRRDSQIKSRGYRIELGEIESAVNTLPGVRESAVVAVQRGGFEGSLICCAYSPAPDRATTTVALRKALSRLVPGYMLPTHWLSYASLPTNANGKVDRRTLTHAFAERLDEHATPATRFA